MEQLPAPGTVGAAIATFRVISSDTSNDTIGGSVMLEPFNLPGMLLVNQGSDLAVTNSPSEESSSSFLLVAGLDGNSDTVSFESVNQKGCYVYSGVNYQSSVRLKLSCNNGDTSETEFSQATSFVMNEGISEYHPISFVAMGARRNFLLEPLLSFRDESYSVYFNIQAQ
ncbi:hypothetical protein SLE2022_401050 [Rubroshorea leprosula]